MFRRTRVRAGFRPGSVVVLLTLLGHLATSIGFPLFDPTTPSKTDSRAYPCRDRPCGCITYEQCWAGDCCCFTLEAKLAWAEANGVEAPEYARQQAESRQSPRESPCCVETPNAETESASRCCEQETAVRVASPGVRWVIGIFAQKCRAETMGLLQRVPGLPVDATPVAPSAPRRGERLVLVSDRSVKQTYRPPTPPPRPARSN